MDVSYAVSMGIGSQQLKQEVTVSAEAPAPTAVSVATGQTAFHVAPFAVDVSQLKAFLFKSDRVVTIKVNDSSEPDQTITLGPTTAFGWVAGSGITCPLLQDITDLYIANASGQTATVSLWYAQDSTP